MSPIPQDLNLIGALIVAVGTLSTVVIVLYKELKAYKKTHAEELKDLNYRIHKLLVKHDEEKLQLTERALLAFAEIEKLTKDVVHIATREIIDAIQKYRNNG